MAVAGGVANNVAAYRCLAMAAHPRLSGIKMWPILTCVISEMAVIFSNDLAAWRRWRSGWRWRAGQHRSGVSKAAGVAAWHHGASRRQQKRTRYITQVAWHVW